VAWFIIFFTGDRMVHSRKISEWKDVMHSENQVPRPIQDLQLDNVLSWDEFASTYEAVLGETHLEGTRTVGGFYIYQFSRRVRDTIVPRIKFGVTAAPRGAGILAYLRLRYLSISRWAGPSGFKGVMYVLPFTILADHDVENQPAHMFEKFVKDNASLRKYTQVANANGTRLLRGREDIEHTEAALTALKKVIKSAIDMFLAANYNTAATKPRSLRYMLTKRIGKLPSSFMCRTPDCSFNTPNLPARFTVNRPAPLLNRPATVNRPAPPTVNRPAPATVNRPARPGHPETLDALIAARAIGNGLTRLSKGAIKNHNGFTRMGSSPGGNSFFDAISNGVNYLKGKVTCDTSRTHLLENESYKKRVHTLLTRVFKETIVHEGDPAEYVRTHYMEVHQTLTAMRSLKYFLTRGITRSSALNNTRIENMKAEWVAYMSRKTTMLTQAEILGMKDLLEKECRIRLDIYSIRDDQVYREGNGNSRSDHVVTLVHYEDTQHYEALDIQNKNKNPNGKGGNPNGKGGKPNGKGGNPNGKGGKPNGKGPLMGLLGKLITGKGNKSYDLTIRVNHRVVT